jgi:hypothetical protein
MEIKQKIYSELSPKQRAVATFLSVNRDDSAEVDRLLANAPRFGGHGKAILGIGQAMDAYNRFISGAVCNSISNSLMLLKSMAKRQWIGFYPCQVP